MESMMDSASLGTGATTTGLMSTRRLHNNLSVNDTSTKLSAE